jgi:glycosyltransferase involved in cell wall biosynthesis
MKAFISIIVPSYNNKVHLTRLLRSIKSNLDRCLYLKDLYEVIVVDDGSQENLYNLKNSFKFKYIKKKNGGAASARNQGAKYAKGKFLFFLDSDLELTSDFLSKVLFFIKSKKINVLSFYYNINSVNKNPLLASKLKAVLDIYLNHKNQDFTKTNSFTDSVSLSIKIYLKELLDGMKVLKNLSVNMRNIQKES